MKKVNHALLSASSAYRWVKCPPSARLENEIRESEQVKPSIYAKEGTEAHFIAESYLKKISEYINKGTGYIFDDGKVAKSIKDIKMKFDNPPGDEMICSVYNYISFVLTKIEESYPAKQILIEKKCDYSEIARGGFGTADCIIVSNDETHLKVIVIDFKYGKGVRVECEENNLPNLQLSLYAFGIIKELSALTSVIRDPEIEICIVQPRLKNYSVYSCSLNELNEKLQEYEIVEKAELAYIGSGEMASGDHCNFCLYAPECPKLTDECTNAALLDYNILPKVDLLKAYEMIPMMESYIKKLKEFMLKKALDGEKIEGYKLVESRGRRIWVNEEEAEKALKDIGMPDSDIYENSIKSPAKISRIIGRTAFKLIEDNPAKLITLADGKPVLAKEDDKRDELENIKDIFNPIKD